MGMYDVLGDGHQVKFFDVPLFYYSENKASTGVHMLGFMGGNLRYFGKGDVVPSRTWWRRPPRNFSIVDLSPFGEETEVSFVIDDRYVDTYEILDLVPNDLLERSEAFYDKWGTRIGGITDKASLIEYAEKYFEYARKYDEIGKSYFAASREFFDFMGKNRERGDALVEDQTYVSLQKRLDEASKRFDSEKERLKERLLGKFLLSSPDAEERTFDTFGAYLEVMRKESEPERRSQKEREAVLTALKREFREWLAKNPIDVERFLERIEATEGERVEIVRLLAEAGVEVDGKEFRKKGERNENG